MKHHTIDSPNWWIRNATFCHNVEFSTSEKNGILQYNLTLLKSYDFTINLIFDKKYPNPTTVMNPKEPDQVVMEAKMNDQTPKNKTECCKENLAKKLLLHADNLFHQRVNIFFVSEAIFFTALSELWDEYCAVKVVVCGFGLIFTLFLWWTLLRLNKGLDWLKRKFRKLDSTGIYEEYDKLGMNGVRSVSVYVCFVPSLFVVGWILLLLMALGLKFCWH